MASGTKKKWVAPSFDDDVMIIESAVNEKSRKRPAEESSWKLRPMTTKSVRTKISEDISWLERFEPKTKKELAVNNKKVEQIETWLLSKFNNSRGGGKSSAILILTGPSGAGKTATLKVLSREHGFEIREWEDPTKLADEWKVDGPELTNQTTAFNNYLFRASRYTNLLKDDNLNGQKASGKRILLVEEIPNIFYKDASNLHSSLRKFRQTSLCPVIFIISDSGNSGQHHNSELTLFPKDIQEELGATVINFNPVTSLSISRTLLTILNALFPKQNVQSYKPDANKLAESCQGDIRGAVNALQLTLGQQSSRPHNKGKIKSFGHKNSSLVLFHSLGKVLYCKRQPDQREPKLPTHLTKMTRVPLKEVPETIFERTLITAEGYVQFLHENYLDFFPTTQMDRAANGAEVFSQIDSTLLSDWSVRDQVTDYVPSIVTRALMFNLPGGDVKASSRALHHFRKAKFYLNRKEINSRLSRIRAQFQCHHLGLGRDLETTLIPYLGMIRPAGLTRAQLDLSASLTNFNAKNHHDSNPNWTMNVVVVKNKSTDFDGVSTTSEAEDPREFNIEEV